MLSKDHLLQAQRNPSLRPGNHYLSIEELETIRLCDLLQIEQNEAADRMGISRKTFWNYSAKNAGMSGNQSAMKDVPQTVQSVVPELFTALAETEEEKG